MRQPLEEHIARTLRARAGTVPDIPDLGERVVTGGRRVRRQRRAYGGIAVVVAVAVAVGAPALIADRDGSRVPNAPVSTPTGQPLPLPIPPPDNLPTPSARPWDDLPLGPATNVPRPASSSATSGSRCGK